MKVSLYDFDKTIYSGDSSIDFYVFCLKRHIGIVKVLPKQIAYALKYKLKKCSKEEFKSVFFSFLQKINDPEIEVSMFWERSYKKIKDYFLNDTEEEKVIISASPEFLLKPICKKLNIKYLIASNVDIKTGIFIDKNCFGEEKVRKFNETLKNCEVINSYSDSLSDLPMLNLAQNKFLVKKNKIINIY